MKFKVLGTLAGTLTLTVLAALVLLGRIPPLDRAYAADEGQSKETSAGAVRVEVVQPVRRTVTRELRMPATLMPDERVDLFAKVSGYVGRIDVDIGSRVGKGDTLAVIDVPEMADELRQVEAVLDAKHAKVAALRAQAAQAELMIETARAEVQRFVAEHDLDQINLTRQIELHQGDAVPEQALDEARSALAVGKAQLQIARAKVEGAGAFKRAVDADVRVAESEARVAAANIARLKTLVGYATIRAPFDGVITERHVDHGAFVRSAAEGTTQPLLTIAKTNRIRLTLDIPETDTPFVHVGTEVEIDVKALRRAPFRATVTRTAGALKVDTRTMRVEVDLDNADGRFTPGMYAQVVVKLESKEQALVIPSKAIHVKGRDTSVLVAENGRARSIPVDLGYDDGIWVEITAGLTGDELVITSSGGAVAPGTPVAAFHKQS